MTEPLTDKTLQLVVKAFEDADIAFEENPDAIFATTATQEDAL